MFELFNKTTGMGEMERKFVLDANKIHKRSYYANVGRKKSEDLPHQG